jgi:hypothetical protein
VGSRFEYQRTNAQWKDVCANIEKFQHMRARNSNITLQVCCTVNIFNIYYLCDVANWIHKQSFDFVYWNILHDAPWLSVAHLPAVSKSAIAAHLKDQLFPAEFQEEMQKVIEFMHQGNSADGVELKKNIEQLDLRRSESLTTVAPELAKVLNYV